jgi:hypothetical protein
MHAEQEYIADVSASLLLAMRADLNLWSKEELERVDAKLAAFDYRASIPRSLFATVEPAWVVPNLGSYGVTPIMLSYSGYQMRSHYLEQYCEEWVPQLLSAGVEAVLINRNEEIFAAVRLELPPPLKLIRLRQIGLTVESAFRRGLGVDGWRDLEDGSRIWVWTRASAFDLTH